MIQDYGFRVYNPSLGKFLSVDPLTASYPWYTPYQFAGNKVIEAIDLDGLEEEKVNKDRNLNAELDTDNVKYAAKKRLGEDYHPKFASPSSLDTNDPVSIAIYREQNRQALHNLERIKVTLDFLTTAAGSMSVSGIASAYAIWRSTSKVASKTVLAKKVATKVLEETASGGTGMSIFSSGVKSTNPDVLLVNKLVKEAGGKRACACSTASISLARVINGGDALPVEQLTKDFVQGGELGPAILREHLGAASLSFNHKSSMALNRDVISQFLSEAEEGAHFIFSSSGADFMGHTFNVVKGPNGAWQAVDAQVAKEYRGLDGVMKMMYSHGKSGKMWNIFDASDL